MCDVFKGWGKNAVPAVSGWEKPQQFSAKLS